MSRCMKKILISRAVAIDISVLLLPETMNSYQWYGIIKGQLILKSFWCLQFSQKTNKNNSTRDTIVVKSNFFVHFLGELKIQKRHFEIN